MTIKSFQFDFTYYSVLMIPEFSSRLIEPKQSLLESIYRDEYSPSNSRPRKMDLFNSFMYTDQITNHTTGLPANNQVEENGLRSSKNDQADNLNNCLNMMKTTRRFQISSLQKKNYKPSYFNESNFNSKQNSKPLDRQSVEKKQKMKYNIRKQKQRKQFLKDKHELSEILKRGPEYSREITNKERKTCPTVDVSRNIHRGEQMRNSHKKWPVRASEQFETYAADGYIKNLNSQIKFQILKKGEYLIKPKIADIVRKKLLTKQSSQPTPVHSNIFVADQQAKVDILSSSFQDIKKQLNNFEFIPTVFREKTFDWSCGSSKEKTNEKLTQQERNIIKAVKTGNYFKAQIQLSMNKKLLDVEDQHGNNLLHLCVMNNHEEMFEMIFRKSIDANVDLLGRQNRFRKNPQDLGNVTKFFKRESLLKTLEKYRRDQYMRIFSQFFFSKTNDHIKE